MVADVVLRLSRLTNVRRYAHQLSNVANPHLALWRGLGWILALWALWQGGGYTYGGNDQVHSPSLYVLSRYPGGMRTHGLIMVILALTLIYTLRTGDLRTKRILELLCGYCFLVSFSVFGSWYLTDQVVLTAPAFWIAFAMIAAVMIMFPPVGSHSRPG